MHIDICSNLSLGMFHHSSDHMLEGRIRKRARVSIIQAATTCHERSWLDFISTPGRPRASSKVDIREIHKLCGWRRVRRRRDCNLLRIKLMNINHRPARFTSPDSTCTSFSFHTLDRITIPSPFSPLFPSHRILPFVSHRLLSRSNSYFSLSYQFDGVKVPVLYSSSRSLCFPDTHHVRRIITTSISSSFLEPMDYFDRCLPPNRQQFIPWKLELIR